MVAQLAKELPGQRPVTMAEEDLGCIVNIAEGFAEENQLLRMELQRCRERQGRFPTKKQLAQGLRAGDL